MKLWKGRFAKEENELANEFNASLPFDRRMWREDITGSIAHAEMLAKQGILTQEDCEKIVSGLKEIAEDFEAGKDLSEPADEDIHMFVERLLTQRIGDAGKKLHTARSRNDQVALDFRMYQKSLIADLDEKLAALEEALLQLAKENTETVLPGYTHLQKAQPVTLAHYMMAYVQMFLRDRKRFQNAFDSANVMPLGSIVLALFCCSRFGWGWDNFIKEVDSGSGIKFPKSARIYVTYILPLILFVIFIVNYINKFS